MTLVQTPQAERPSPTAVRATGQRFRFLTLALVALAVWWRLPSGAEWPMTFHLPLQFESADSTRTIWLRLRPGPQSEREAAWLANVKPGITAPPILQTLTATVYLVIGHEYPAASAVIASLFWLAGGWFVYVVARRLALGRFGAVVSLGFYLLAPFGIIVSQSFQPEALLVCAFMGALACLMHYRERLHTLRGAIICGLVLGLAAFVKPGITLFPLAGAYLALAIGERGWRRVIFSPMPYLIGLLTVLPSVIYALVFLRHHVGAKIMPQLLLTEGFWRGWALNVQAAVAWWAVVPALLGAMLMARASRMYLGIGLFAGYLLYGAAFTWHSMTHNYYQVPLIPIVAICLAPVAQRLFDLAIARRAALSIVCSVVVLGGVILLALPANRVLASRSPQTREVEEGIGRRIGCQARVLTLTGDYGLSLQYHAWAPVKSWPDRLDQRYEQLQGQPVLEAGARLDHIRATFQPSHFVITRLDELRQQRDLVALLESRYEVCYKNNDCLVYDLRARR